MIGSLGKKRKRGGVRKKKVSRSLASEEVRNLYLIEKGEEGSITVEANWGKMRYSAVIQYGISFGPRIDERTWE